MERVLRVLWASPWSLLGLGFASLARLTGGSMRLVDGVVEAHGGAVSWLLLRAVPLRGGCSALTLGHVVLGRTAELLERSRAHERVHVAQYERWGPLFLPVYLLSSAVALARGRDVYLANRFEREAYARGGGLREEQAVADSGAKEC